MDKHLIKPVTLAIGMALAVAACGNGADNSAAHDAASSTTSAAASVARAATTAPVTSGELAVLPNQALAFNVDTSFDACNDFANYVNAKWNQANPIPSDRTRWGAFGILRKRSMQQQRVILEDAAATAKQGQGSQLEQKLGRLYAAGMDSETINKLGFTPIQDDLAKIDALKSTDDIVKFLQDSFNAASPYVFYFGARADFKDATQQIGYVYQSGLGLPTRAYYLEDKHQDKRDAYVKYIAKSLELVGTPTEEAQKQARGVLEFETQLAKASLAPEELRNLDNQYNFVTVEEANKVSPHFDWGAFFNALGVDIGEGFSLSQPKFIAEFDKLLAEAPVSQWQAYFKAHLIDSAAPYLSDEFQQAHFSFHGQAMNGQPEQKPRWERVLDAVNGSMGMGLGELYAERYFPPETKARAEQLVDNVRDALKQHIEGLTWMSDETKKKALEKWSMFLPKIGYPDKGEWRDWSGLDIQAGHWLANLEAASKYNYHYNLGKIGTRTNRKTWHMTPQTVNAYYNPSTNTINFPAAILQPPFFYADGDDAVNYGGIGFVIGHEAIHGFDDQGSQFDGFGNRANWWTAEDKKQFDALTGALGDQYSAYAPIPGKPDLHVNGKLTMGENIADLGGLNVAYTALQMALQADPAKNRKIEGFTPEQRFFMSSARVWEGTVRPERQEVMLNVDPHSPAKIRAFASSSNMSQFAQAFQCKAGDKMVRKNPVKIW